MFNDIKGKIHRDHNPRTSIQEAVDQLNHAMIESNHITSMKVKLYGGLLSEALSKNDGVYDESVTTILTEASKDIIEDVINDANETISGFEKIRSSVKMTLDTLKKANSDVTHRYQPLLKQVDVSKVSYTVPRYNLDTLSTSELLSRAKAVIEDVLELDTKNVTKPIDEIERINDAYYKCGMGNITETLKKALLGVPSTITVGDSMYTRVRDSLVDPTATETRYFTDEVFATLLSVDSYINIDEINAIILELENEIINCQESKKIFLDEGNEYAGSIITKFFVNRKMAMCYTLSLIVEVIRIKSEILEELSVNYRRIVINTYDTVQNRADPFNKLNESYLPHADSEIGILYTECAIPDQLFKTNSVYPK